MSVSFFYRSHPTFYNQLFIEWRRLNESLTYYCGGPARFLLARFRTAPPVRALSTNLAPFVLFSPPVSYGGVVFSENPRVNPLRQFLFFASGSNPYLYGYRRSLSAFLMSAESVSIFGLAISLG